MLPVDRLKWYLHEHPLFYPLFHNLSGRTWGVFCNKGTDFCIEGYQSSSNSFVYNVFRLLDPSLNIGHHTHSVANLKRCLRYAIPTLVLYRDPDDAIPSLVARFKPTVSEGATRYCRFYQFVMRHKRQFILASFEETTSNISSVIRRVEECTSLEFGHHDADAIAAQAVKHIRKWSEKHGDTGRISLPKKEREREKNRIRQRLQNLPQYEEVREAYEKLSAESASRTSLATTP